MRYSYYVGRTRAAGQVDDGAVGSSVAPQLALTRPCLLITVLQVPAGKRNEPPFSMDANLLHISYEG